MKEEEVQIKVTLTISKTMTISTSNYEILDEGKDENGYYRNIEFYDLGEAIMNKVTLPTDLSEFVENQFSQDLDLRAAGKSKGLQMALDACKDWYIEDYNIEEI